MLLLFDIDGTLLRRAAEAHRDAIYVGLRTVYGIDPAKFRIGVATAGRTDGEIVRMIALQAGVSATAIDDGLDAVKDETCRAYAELATEDLSHTVIEGNVALLEWASAQPQCTLALVTGNYEAVARIKLKQAGIGHFFPSGQGGFGSDDEDRTALPPIARRRAGTGGVSYPRERTIVLGDTPRDIACARADDVRVFAVTSGPFDAAELAEADAVAANAAGHRERLAAELAGE